MFKNGFFIVVFICFLFSPQAFTKDCAYYKSKIEHLEDLRRNGGKAAKMNRWRNQGHALDEKLSRCRNDGGSTQVIQVVNGSQATTKNTRAIHHHNDGVSHVPNTIVTSPSIANVRNLRECIKPNNLVDNEVSDCMKGNRNPSWNK
jgi:hypothetical protein